MRIFSLRDLVQEHSKNGGSAGKTLSELNEDLVMVRVTGFGQTGLYKDRPGFGTLVETMSGYTYSTGQPDRPPTLPPTAMADSICALHSQP